MASPFSVPSVAALQQPKKKNKKSKPLGGHGTVGLVQKYLGLIPIRRGLKMFSDPAHARSPPKGERKNQVVTVREISRALVLTLTPSPTYHQSRSRPAPQAAAWRRGGEGRGEEGGDRGRKNGEAPARSGAGGGGADLAGEQPGRRLPHAHLQLPQPNPRFDLLF
jgi:hypothetical protein